MIEPARRPDGPYSPNVRRTVMLATFLGLFFGIGLVLGLDYLDQTLRSPDQVEKYLGLETLAALPKMTDDNSRVLRESFQSLRTAIMLASRGEECHVVMVTSAVPEEGKTTVAFNLAKVLATGGGRVLLIDADLRKPRIHRMIKAKNVRGLTSVVLGERSAGEVIHPYSYDGMLTTSGSFLGFGLGVILLNLTGMFSHEGEVWKRILRYPVGIIGVLILYLGLGSIFPDDVSLISYSLRFFRYFLIGFWISYGAPRVFSWLKLSQ